MKHGKEEGGIRFGQIVFGCLALAFLSVFVSHFAKSGAFRPLGSYESVQCRIERSSVKQERVDSFVLTAEFSYDYAGAAYKSSSLRTPGGRMYGFSDLAGRLPLLEKYAPGTVHTCRVDPLHPADAFLPIENPVEDDTGILGSAALLIPAAILLVFFCVAVGMIASAFPSVRRRFKPSKGKPFLGVFLLLFSLPFAGTGIGGLVWLFRSRAEVADYVPVPAKVLYSDVTRHVSHGKNGHTTTYGVCVGYEYSVNGQKYESNRYARPDIKTSGYERHRREAESYRKGDDVTAYVSPRDPRRSVLVQKDSTTGIVLPMLMGTFALVGLVVMGCGLWALLSGTRGPRAPVSYESRPLRRSRSDLVTLCAFAVFWNLIAWTATIAVASDAIHDGMRVEYLLVAIFPLVGLGIAGAFFCMLVRELRAPKLSLSLSCASWERGAGAQVDWIVDDPDAVESLEIFLEGARMERHGKHSCRVVVSSESCCRQDAPVPQGWRFGFPVPDVEADGLTWSLSVHLRAKGVRKEYEWRYPL